MGEIILLEQQNNLTENKAKEIEKLYLPMVKALNELEKEFNEVVSMETNKETSKLARDLRIRIGKTRIEADKVRKKAKENILIEGNAIQSAYNTLLYVTKTKEDKLLDIELHEEKKEALRIANLQDEREHELKKYTENIPTNLGEFTDEVWSDYITGVKKNHEERIAREKEEQAKKEEQERIAKLHNERKEKLIPYWQFIGDGADQLNFGTLDSEDFEILLQNAIDDKKYHEKEQEEIKKENEKLKVKQAKTENRIKQLQKYSYFIKDLSKYTEISDEDYIVKIDEFEKHHQEKELEKKEAQRLAEETKAKLEEKERLEKERKINEDLIAEQELKKGDEDKIIDMIKDFENIKTKYTFRSQQNQKKYSEVKQLIDKVINHIKK
jgi:hypothetical protein